MPGTLTEDPERILMQAGADAGVLAHCRAVSAVARAWEHNPLVDGGLLRAGAMLHDIGRTVTHTVAHAQGGARLCRSLGLPEEVAKIVERHIGAGLTADECSLLRLLPKDCMPESIEERIVAHADNCVEGAREASIYRLLQDSTWLKRRVRKRIYRLSLEMEQIRG